MTLITTSSFLSGVDAIAALDPAYAPGHDGSDGECDCIGLIIGAIRRSGGEWSGIHGSNYAARNAMRTLQPIQDAADLRAGDVVFKARDHASPGYALPSRYDGHSDRLDYYHAGVVRSVSPLEIIHCTTPGILRDVKLGQWSHHGTLTTVAGDNAQRPAATIVTAEKGSTVNLRRTPGGALAERIPVGAAVTVTGHTNGWSLVQWNGRSGWMMDKYLAPQQASDAVALTLPKEAALQLQTALAAALQEVTI